ncbi:fasciclin-like arabinogalactan protein 3 [Panicum virgatum]|uniref:fasciclin-like arabinogalactan protein 3 n=1 Tax=Panicum virgatum TaxID=38727 RepID=UPI0019D505F5|nr:fasciclin-like arabinogalactan protein 3 [Panicum virgatum]
MLTETNVALAISSRDKVTVLALNNTAAAVAFGGTLRVPRSLLADLLALHVVLDYIDKPRLGALQHDRKGEGSVVTTLLQVLRAPPRGVGFLRVYTGDAGRAMLSSAAPGGLGRNATVEKQITAKPYSVSVLQVSGFVVPPGIRVPRAFPPRASRHMAAPPHKEPALAPVPAPAPFFGSGPLVPSPIKPVPTPNLVDTPAPVPEETGVIPIPSVHGGLAAKPVFHNLQHAISFHFHLVGVRIRPNEQTNEQVVRKSDASQIQQNDRILITESLNIISSPSFQFKLQMFMTV